MCYNIITRNGNPKHQKGSITMTVRELRAKGYIEGRTALERSYTSRRRMIQYEDRTVLQSPKTKEYYVCLPNRQSTQYGTIRQYFKKAR